MNKIMGRRDVSLLRKIIALALLPSEHILDTFNDLRSKYEDDENERFFLYIESEWIRKVIFRFRNFSSL